MSTISFSPFIREHLTVVAGSDKISQDHSTSIQFLKVYTLFKPIIIRILYLISSMDSTMDYKLATLRKMPWSIDQDEASKQITILFNGVSAKHYFSGMFVKM